MRTVLVSALTALAVAALVSFVLPPRSAPSAAVEPHPEVLRRLDALEQALATFDEAEPVRLEGPAAARAQHLQALEARLARVEAAAEARATTEPDLSSSMDAEAAAAAAAATEAKQEADAQYQKWIDNLYAKNENIAFSASLELGRLKDPRAVKPLAYVLGTHGDFYVRLGCATALGDIGDPAAVPSLIDALDDKDQLARTAASDALKKITSADIPYDASASKVDRENAQVAWRDWFKENEGRLRSARER